jgi:hypothetical protein
MNWLEILSYFGLALCVGLFGFISFKMFSTDKYEYFTKELDLENKTA